MRYLLINKNYISMLFCPNYSIIIWKQTSFMMHWIIIGLSKRFNIKRLYA